MTQSCSSDVIEKRVPLFRNHPCRMDAYCVWQFGQKNGCGRTILRWRTGDPTFYEKTYYPSYLWKNVLYLCIISVMKEKSSCKKASLCGELIEFLQQYENLAKNWVKFEVLSWSLVKTAKKCFHKRCVLKTKLLQYRSIATAPASKRGRKLLPQMLQERWTPSII